MPTVTVTQCAVLAGGLGSSEWGTFLELASRAEVKTLCARGLSLSIHLFNTNVPHDTLVRLDNQSRAQKPEPSAVFLKKDLRKVDLLASDLRALGPRAGLRLVREHLFPPASYIEAMYGVRNRALMPMAYARRIVSGVGKWFRPQS